jgi:hypothetical protein
LTDPNDVDNVANEYPDVVSMLKEFIPSGFC